MTFASYSTTEVVDRGGVEALRGRAPAIAKGAEGVEGSGPSGPASPFHGGVLRGVHMTGRRAHHDDDEDRGYQPASFKASTTLLNLYQPQCGLDVSGLLKSIERLPFSTASSCLATSLVRTDCKTELRILIQDTIFVHKFAHDLPRGLICVAISYPHYSCCMLSELRSWSGTIVTSGRRNTRVNCL